MRRKLPQGRVRQWLPIKEYTKTRVEKVGSNSISESLEIERERETERARCHCPQIFLVAKWSAHKTLFRFSL